MIKKMLPLLFMTHSLFAQQNSLTLNYDGFFDRMDDLSAAEYRDIKLAFYLVDPEGQPCEVSSANLTTKLNSKEVYVLNDGELLLPFDEKLDQNKAAIEINYLGNKTCGLNMRLESSILMSSKYTIEQLSSLVKTFSLALDDLGGMLSFLLPTVTGLTFEATNKQTLSFLNQELSDRCNQQNKCTITIKQIMALNSELILNTSPFKIVPFINK